MLILVLGLALTGCSFVRIQNVSNTPVTVLVMVPDAGAGYTRHIRDGSIVDVFSSHGGHYTVTIVPSELYRTTLENLRAAISQRLFKERATLTGEQVARLVENLNEVNRLIEDLAKPGQSCSGNVPDFDTSVVVIAFDSTAGEYALSCSSGQ